METETTNVEAASSPAAHAPVIAARLFAGLVVLMTAEVFSGASLRGGLWSPWTLLVTYWLYFAHFFFFTTLAVWTGRTSLASLYLWGVLFGLYESWITKVIWSGYGRGAFALGHIGPYGYSEISMVFFYHPVASFIVPLTLLGLLSPAVRAAFPQTAWLTGSHKLARAAQIYLAIAFATIMGMNSGGLVNLALNIAFGAALMLIAWRIGRPVLTSADTRPFFVFGRRGFIGLCLYLLLLYGAMYPSQSNRLPSAPVQLFTLVFYVLAIGGLIRHRRLEPLRVSAVTIPQNERKWFAVLGAAVFVAALGLSPFAGRPVLAIASAAHLLLWTPLGFGLTILALVSSGAPRRVALTPTSSVSNSTPTPAPPTRPRSP